MMKMAMLKTHYTPEEAHSLLMLLDELRDTIWNNYREEIIEYASQQQTEEINSPPSCSEFEDDSIPF